MSLSREHLEAFGESGPAPVWFHGHVDRPTTDSRLVGMPDGTFLIRDSSASGNFVLSVTEQRQPNHYLVTRLGPHQYQIGDVTFVNLPAIIEHFQRKPLDSCCLSSPLPLNSAFESGTLNPNFLFATRAKYNFNARDPEDLSFRKGELLNILQQHEAEWWKAQSQKTLQIGVIPSNYVERIEPEKPAAFNDQPLYQNDDATPTIQTGELYMNDAAMNQPLAEIDVTPINITPINPTPLSNSMPTYTNMSHEQKQSVLAEFLPRVTFNEEVPDERPKFLVAKALMDRSTAGYDKTALSFHEGDTIQITKQHESGLWEGKILGGDERIGHFPFTQVELLDCGQYDEDLQQRSVRFEVAMDNIYGSL